MRIQILMALVFVVAIDLILMSSQYSVFAMANESGITNPTDLGFTFDESYIGYYDTSDGDFILSQNPESDLPSEGASVEDDNGGNFFTDLYVRFKSWLSNTTGFSYLIRLVTAVPNFLKTIGMPAPLAFALGVLWHGFTFILFIMFLRGSV